MRRFSSSSSSQASRSRPDPARGCAVGGRQRTLVHGRGNRLGDGVRAVHLRRLERRSLYSAEVRDRRRTMVRALLLSIGIVTVLYLLVNLAYLKGLGYGHDALGRGRGGSQ